MSAAVFVLGALGATRLTTTMVRDRFVGAAMAREMAFIRTVFTVARRTRHRAGRRLTDPRA